MRLRTGLKALVGLSAVGVAVAILLIFTCPFGGHIAFSTLVRQVHTEHGDTPEQHAQEHHGAAPEGHTAAEHHEAHNGLTVHLMVIPGVRAYPVQETKVFGIEVAPLGILVLLFIMALSYLILRQRRWRVLGYSVTPRSMGIAVFLVTLWNVVVAAFLLIVEIVQLKELWLTWLAFDATVVASVVVVFVTFTKQVVPLRLKSFEQLDEWIGDVSVPGCHPKVASMTSVSTSVWLHGACLPQPKRRGRQEGNAVEVGFMAGRMDHADGQVIDYLLLGSKLHPEEAVRLEDARTHCVGRIRLVIAHGQVIEASPEEPLVYRGGTWGSNHLFRSEEHLQAWLRGAAPTGATWKKLGAFLADVARESGGTTGDQVASVWDWSGLVRAWIIRSEPMAIKRGEESYMTKVKDTRSCILTILLFPVLTLLYLPPYLSGAEHAPASEGKTMLVYPTSRFVTLNADCFRLNECEQLVVSTLKNTTGITNVVSYSRQGVIMADFEKGKVKPEEIAQQVANLMEEKGFGKVELRTTGSRAIPNTLTVRLLPTRVMASSERFAWISCATRAVEWVKKLPGIQEVDFLGPEHMVVVDFDPKEVNGKGIAAMILMSLEYPPPHAGFPPYTIEYVKDWQAEVFPTATWRTRRTGHR